MLSAVVPCTRTAPHSVALTPSLTLPTLILAPHLPSSAASLGPALTFRFLLESCHSRHWMLGGWEKRKMRLSKNWEKLYEKCQKLFFFFSISKVLSNHFKRKVQDGGIKIYINTLDKQLKSQRHKNHTVHQSAHTHLHSHTSTHIHPQSPETWLKEQNYRSVGWQARMDEQAGQLEHHRTASVPPIPHIAPPKYPHQKWGLTRARGCKTGPTLLKLHPTAEGQKKDIGRRGCVQ